MTTLLAYVANNDSNDLLTAEAWYPFGSADLHWTGSRVVEGQSSKFAPALQFVGLGPSRMLLLLAYVANNNSNDLLTAESMDGGLHWTGSRVVEGQSSKTAPALVNLRGIYLPGPRLVLAYVANNNSNDLLTAASTDGGLHWTGSRVVGPPFRKTVTGGVTRELLSSKTAPALLSNSDQL